MPRSNARLASVATLAFAGSLAMLIAVALLLMPNSVHVGAQEDFYDCGLSVFPTARPHQEPGITKCREYNESMRSKGYVFGAVGLLALAASVGVLAPPGRGSADGDDQNLRSAY